MSRILVEVDTADLDRAKRILGTNRNVEAVQLALREVIAGRARRELIEMFRRGAFADLADPEVRKVAWS
jgi:Arc/MetJ family transcription regulator